jgi:16S rRNA processing protein RimM
MEVLTEFPERLERGRAVYVGEDYNPFILRSVRRQADFLLVAFQGIHNPEQAGDHRNQLVFVRADQVPSLSDGEFYHHQIVGLKVISDTGIELGVVGGVLETGSNDVLVVHPERGQDILLPFTDEVMLQIDLEGGLITVHLLPGLLP